MPQRNPKSKEQTAKVAKAALTNKRVKTPLEDALAQGDGDRTVKLVQWARQQYQQYHSDLTTWRENRRKYAQESQDVFTHREAGVTDPGTHDTPRMVFEFQNKSLNIVAGLAEFAAAQAEQDLFGGEPWFAAVPVGKSDPVLADNIQKHLQWSFRDGRLASKYCSAVTLAACLGEAFTKTTYDIETDRYEGEIDALHVNGQPVMNGDAYVTTDEEAKALTPPPKGKLEWKKLFVERDEVIRHGVETAILHHNDVAFREDAPELDLKYTNFYNLIELSVLEARQRFNLSLEDAVRLGLESNTSHTVPTAANRPDTVDAQNRASGDDQRNVYGDEETERALNMRVRLVEGYVKVDPFGDGIGRRLYIVFTPSSEDWLVYGNYLANLSPKGELPVKCHVWEEVPGKLYGRGFFGKYASVQLHIDDTWNQVGFRNRLHSNPIGAFNPAKLERDDDESDLELRPGDMLRLKGDATLDQVIQFMEIPDMDSRSMELLQIGMQMAQLRSGITSASQGDLSSVPENNTATGIRQLMSRAAVLMKKPVRGLRRSFNGEFSFAVKLHYANFDRTEAFQVGEGENTKILEMTPEMVRNLDIDVRMLLTQEQNQTKLQGAQVATGLLAQYIGTPEFEKPHARPLYVQAMKALEFDQPEEIIREPMVALEDAMASLPPEQQQRLTALLQLEAAAAQPQGPTNPAAPAAPAPQQPATTKTPQ